MDSCDGATEDIWREVEVTIVALKVDKGEGVTWIAILAEVDMSADVDIEEERITVEVTSLGITLSLAEGATVKTVEDITVEEIEVG